MSTTTRDAAATERSKEIVLSEIFVKIFVNTPFHKFAYAAKKVDWSIVRRFKGSDFSKFRVTFASFQDEGKKACVNNLLKNCERGSESSALPSRRSLELIRSGTHALAGSNLFGKLLRLLSTYGDNPLKLASHGECPPPRAAPASTVPPATAAPAIQTGIGSIGMTATVGMTTTTVMITSTTAATTADPIHSIVQNVFCQNAASISCANDFQIICGSEGQLHPNQSEMSKQKCVDPTLTVADKSICPIPGR
ncbi:uncharacterized protein LOC128549193 [Mercenaria mercenaria]|uniref:uncharacterized protein LOC128549193 n=1 Tax=Mercenaria mercenaria TaxID=6596 RepID=UPI00234E8DC8|nr:uncharacterized protein LOC128549193 [Mercenaria mercenaria]